MAFLHNINHLLNERVQYKSHSSNTKYIIVTLLLIITCGTVGYVNGIEDNTIPEVFLLKNYSTNNDPTKAKSWYLSQDPRQDERLGGTNVITGVSDDEDDNLVVKIQPSGDKRQVRLNVFAGNETDLKRNIESVEGSKPDQNVMSERGFMFEQNDWKNVEVTEYVKVNQLGTLSTNGGKHIELEGRSGVHSDGKYECQGTSYHFNVYEDGRVKMEKELKHNNDYYPNSDDDPVKHNVINGLKDEGWIGIKMVVLNVPNGVNVKGYLNLDSPEDTDLPTNNWTLVLEKTDNGNNWHTDNGKSACPDSNSSEFSGRLIDWGGPIVIFRSDNLKDVDWKWASVREISSQ